jgi:hypothetical protein
MLERIDDGRLNGDPGRIRTCDPQLRRLLLYPAELRGHCLWSRWGFAAWNPPLRSHTISSRLSGKARWLHETRRSLGEHRTSQNKPITARYTIAKGHAIARSDRIAPLSRHAIETRPAGSHASALGNRDPSCRKLRVNASLGEIASGRSPGSRNAASREPRESPPISEPLIPISGPSPGIRPKKKPDGAGIDPAFDVYSTPNSLQNL